MDKLLPCPFCGYPPEWGHVTHTGGHYILCDSDDCRMTTTDAYPDKVQAVAQWNTRHTQTEHKGK